MPFAPAGTAGGDVKMSPSVYSKTHATCRGVASVDGPSTAPSNAMSSTVPHTLDVPCAGGVCSAGDAANWTLPVCASINAASIAAVGSFIVHHFLVIDSRGLSIYRPRGRGHARPRESRAERVFAELMRCWRPICISMLFVALIGPPGHSQALASWRGPLPPVGPVRPVAKE